MQNWTTIFGCGLPIVLETSFRPSVVRQKLEHHKHNWGLHDRGLMDASDPRFDSHLNDARNGFLRSDIKGWFLGVGYCYAVNPPVFGSICAGPIPFFRLSITWLVRYLRRGRATGAHRYLLVASKNIPGWVYSFIAGMLELCVCSTVRKIRSQIGRGVA